MERKVEERILRAINEAVGYVDEVHDSVQHGSWVEIQLNDGSWYEIEIRER